MIRKSKMAALAAWMLCLMPFMAPAQQQYKIKAALDAVPATGFYKIPIIPELTAIAREDLADIRVADSAGRYVPYIMYKAPRAAQGPSFTAFPIMANATDSGHTIVDIQNPVAAGISSLALVIRNTAVARYTSLSGSDDGRAWYIIDDHMLFHSAEGGYGGGASYIQTIQFPLSRYRYFRLRINNAHTDPLSIEQAGQYHSSSGVAAGDTVTNPSPIISQVDTNGTSYVTIRNTAPYRVDKLTLAIIGTKLYKRNGTAYIITDTAMNKGAYAEARPFMLASGAPALLDIGGIKVTAIKLEIENKDDQPLRTIGANTTQQLQYITAWLEKGRPYYLLAGNAAAPPPHYDLSEFRDSIPATLQTVAYRQLTPMPLQLHAPLHPENNGKWLWICIIAGIAVMGGLTYRLVKDMGKGGNI